MMLYPIAKSKLVWPLFQRVICCFVMTADAGGPAEVKTQCNAVRGGLQRMKALAIAEVCPNRYIRLERSAFFISTVQPFSI